MGAALPVIGGVAANLIGGIAGANAAKAGQQSAQDRFTEAMNLYGNLDIPDTAKQQLALEHLQSQGQLTPEMIQAVTLGPSAMENVSVDPRLKQEQMTALQQMSGISQKGFTPEDAAAMELARRSAAGEAQAKQGQILQEMQSRGQGGSGAELLAKLQSSESSADRLQESQLQQAMAAAQNRRSALEAMSNMASSMRGQEFGEQSSVAKAKDIQQQYNAQNLQNVMQQNIAARNQAQAQNLAQAQAIANQNVALNNQQQMHNKQLLQQQYENQLRRTQGMTGQLQNMAQASQSAGANQAAMYGQLGQSAGNLFSAFKPGGTEPSGSSSTIGTMGTKGIGNTLIP